MNFPTLYKKSKNDSIQTWKIWTDGNIIKTEHGKLDGKLQNSEKVAKSKNINKKNETSPEKQAELTAQSMWNKKKDKGYFETMNEAENEIVFLPMLATDILKMSKTRKESLFKNALYAQPKLDGVRCLARWNGDRIQLLSRGGKEYIILHISKALEAVIKPGQVLDGEIYIHGVLRQDINALVKKHREEEYKDTGYCSKDLEYWVYDTFNINNLDEPFRQRNIVLAGLNLDDKIIRHVSTTVVETPTELKNIHKLYTDEQFEGTILRIPDGPYELGHRSQHLIKYKDFIDDEFEIIDFKDGEGKFKGCVIWVCRVGEDQTVDVVPKGTLKQKKEWFRTADQYIGKEITVKYQSLSKDGIPEFPVGLGWRLPGDK
jgi:DNA ligase-1